MRVVWGLYSPFDPSVTRPLHEVSKKEARSAFERLIAACPERVSELAQLLRLNGVPLDSSNEGVQLLNDWFRANVEGDPTSVRLLPMWYAVVNDIALFLGQTLIERRPNLSWVFYDKGAKDVAFQRHVIMGFSNVSNPKYNVDIDLLVATYGHRVIAGKVVAEDAFVQMITAAEQRA